MNKWLTLSMVLYNKWAWLIALACLLVLKSCSPEIPGWEP